MKPLLIVSAAVAASPPQAIDILENVESQLAKLRELLSGKTSDEYGLKTKLGNVYRAHVLVGDDSTLVIPVETMDGQEPGERFYISDDMDIVRV